MPEPEINAQAGAPAAAAASVAGSAPVGTVADGAGKPSAEPTPKEESTLLGGEAGGEKAGEEGKPAEGAKPVVPEKYDIKVAEGMTLDQGLVDKVTPIFKELGITQEGAQKLADAYAPYVNQVLDTQVKTAVGAFNNMVGEWKTETTKELSKDGAKPDVELSHAARFIDKFGGPALREVLNETGLGNHIALVKAFISAGKAMANDSFPDSGKKGPVADSPEAKAATLYPTTAQQQQ